MQPPNYGPVGPAPTQSPVLKIALLVTGTIMTIFIVLAVILASGGIDSQLENATLGSAEMQRIAELATDSKAASVDTKNHATTTARVARSHVMTLRVIGDTPTDKQLTESFNQANDVALTQALNDGLYNETYIDIMVGLIDQTTEPITDMIAGDTDDTQKALLQIMLEDLQLIREALAG